MTAWVVAVALAGGLTHRPTREPLPAREVERPVVLPSGWSTMVVGGGVGEVSGIDVAGRLSLGSGVELNGALPWRAGSGRWGRGAATLGLAWSPWRREAPSRSVAFVGAWTSPQGPSGWGPSDHEGLLGVQGRWQWGGLRFDGELSGVHGPLGGSGLRGVGGVLLQAGPLGMRGEGTIRADGLGWSVGRVVGGFVQLNRAVKLQGEVRVDPPRSLARPPWWLGMELAL